MNSRMTLRQLCDTVCDGTKIYIQSDEDTSGNLVPLSYGLRGCAGVMSIEVMRFYTIGEYAPYADIVALLDIPARWLEQEEQHD